MSKKTVQTPKASRKAAPKQVPHKITDYAVQAHKLRNILDTLVGAEEVKEESLLLNLNAKGFAAHPRTLQRDMGRLSILGFPVIRISAPEGIFYQLPKDETLSESLAALDALRKSLHAEGSSHEKELAAIIRKLKT